MQSVKIKRVSFVNKKETLYLIKQAFLNNGGNGSPFLVDLVPLELDKELYSFLCEKIDESFLALKEMKILTSRHSERHPHTGLIHHLVFYKWQQEKENNTLSLLQMWADLGYYLAKEHYFTNGNKRTAFLSMFIFILTCGFKLRIDGKKWEKLFMEIVMEEDEKLAIEKIKERIKLDLCLTKNEKQN